MTVTHKNTLLTGCPVKRVHIIWCKGYYVDTVGKNTSRIAEYIRNQLEEDKLGDQLSIAEVGYLSKKKK